MTFFTASLIGATIGIIIGYIWFGLRFRIKIEHKIERKVGGIILPEARENVPKGYISHTMSDEEWKFIQKLINTRKGQKGRPPPKDARRLLDGIFYKIKTGCSWANVPKEFGLSPRVYKYFFSLKSRGVIIEDLMNQLEQK